MKVGPDVMTSAETRHVARWSSDAAADGGGAWVVSWLPMRLMRRDQAVTAMMIAEKVGQGHDGPGDRDWPLIENWARELGLRDGVEAVALVAVR